MALAFNRTIESPGVEIREIDLSLYAGLPVGTNVMAMGFARQGPIDELLNITSIDEFEAIYGKPKNAAERYFYHSCRQILLKNGNLVATRLPYGESDGEGYGSEYSILAYPMAADTATLSTVCVVMNEYNTYNTWSDSLTGEFLTSVAMSSYFTKSDPYTDIQIFGGEGVSANNCSFPFLSAILGETDGWTNVVYTSNTPVVATIPGGYEITRTFTLWSADRIIPVSDTTSVSAVSAYRLGEPKQMIIDEHEYTQLSQGSFLWTGEVSALASDCSQFTDFQSLSAAGMIVLNKNRVATNEYMESTYILLADNSKVGYGTDYDCITGFKTKINDLDSCDFFPIRESSLNFELTGTYKASRGSTSELIESIATYDLTPPKYNDTLVMGVLKLRKSIYNNQGVQQIVLDQVVQESFIGSMDMYRKEVPVRGAVAETFFLEDIVNDSSNTIQLLINPLVSKTDWSKGTDINGDESTKEIRVNDEAMNGYALGAYVPNYTRNKAREIGNLGAKIERALRLAENIDYVPLDIIVEAGLGTIGTYCAVANEIKNTTGGSSSKFYNLYSGWDGGYYDDMYLPGILEDDAVVAGTYLPGTPKYVDISQPGVSPNANDAPGIGVALKTPEYGPNDRGGRDSFIANEYQGYFELFREFAEFTRRPGTLFIADPLRHIFVQGNKVIGECRLWDEENSEMIDANFPQHIYWPLRNLYAESSTSYSCVYANWVKALDTESNNQVWLPFSGFEAGIMCDVDRNTFPWFAPAGLNRGRISGITQIGYNTTQKQRDLLYRHSLNPVVFFPQDGFVVWGQKTLLKNPSAFDRINVRRLFLVLEKATVATSRYFVFEPNTIFTRTRLVDTIKPIFERAKNNEGLYDYMIVCDERNNTPDTIDRNELIVDIYLKPVRTAEFILISFIATRTGQDFSELV
jgi:hypothetical protein